MKKAHKYDQLLQIGAKVGEWEILSPPFRDHNGRAMVQCRCSCGREQDVFAYPLVKGKTTQCKKCSSGKTPTVGGLSGMTLRSAIGQGAKFSLSPAIISQSLSLQGNTCAISHEPIALNSAAVVRVDNSQGYTPTNSVIVSQTMKEHLKGVDLNTMYSVVNTISQTPIPRPHITIQDFLNKRETQ